MTGRIRKLGTLVAVVATAALTLSAVGAHASPNAKDTDDKYKPAGKVVKGHSNSTVFSVLSGALVVTCTDSNAGGKTPATGSGLFAIKPLPTFDDGAGKPCTDNSNGTDTTTTTGAWKIGLIDAPNDESQTEPNSGDKLKVIVPKAGAVVHNSLGCTITVAPNGPFTVTGTYDDHSQFTVNISNLPIKVTGPVGCPTDTSSTFKATYTFTPGVSDGS